MIIKISNNTVNLKICIYKITKDAQNLISGKVRLLNGVMLTLIYLPIRGGGIDICWWRCWQPPMEESPPEGAAGARRSPAEGRGGPDSLLNVSLPLPIPEIHSVGGVLVHMPHVRLCIIHTLHSSSNALIPHANCVSNVSNYLNLITNKFVRYYNFVLCSSVFVEYWWSLSNLMNCE